ncbi:hypothetical protein J1614_006269 [Plenodomus biglobosus]|nr:hypothetical protein J1614_006269 [Plenodomus biglobosus]
MTLRDNGDKDAIEFGKAEPYLWELMLFWEAGLGRGGMARMAKSGRVQSRPRGAGAAKKARGSVRGRWYALH